MANLTSTFVGITSPNPFWLASAPPTDKEYNVRRAFQAGWGGVVWKTLGEAGPPVVNVNGPRYGVVYGADRRVLGINNIELITDRPLQTNLDEIARVKKDWPDRAIIASIMVPCEEGSWKAILPRVAAIPRPNSRSRLATTRPAGLSPSARERKTVPLVGSRVPAASSALKKALPNVASMPITSPVERISGPSAVSTSGNRLNGSTASLMAT